MNASAPAPIVSVITPTFNEVENLPVLVPRIHAALGDTPHEIVIADDNSPDRTWAVAEEIAAGDDSVVVLRRFHDHGLSAAVLDGMSAARAPYLAVIDADLQHDPSVLGEMLARLRAGDADVVVGSREADGGGYGEWSARRRFVSWVAAGIARLFLRVPTGDPMSGYFMLTRGAYESTAAEINPLGFKILLEFIGRNRALRVQDVGYTFANRVHGETKLKPSVIRSYLLAVAELRLGRQINPVFFLYVLVGILGVAVNSVLFTLFEALGFPRIDTGLNEALDPIYSSFVASVVLTTLLLFVINNEFTFWEQRYRGWRTIGALLLYGVMTGVGTLVHVAVFSWLQETGFLFNLIGDDAARVVHNLVGAMVALVVNWYLNTTFVWRRRLV
ncbi:MAG: glycosyltransferase family 2 protein [Microthrixaceae bacterium]|nr:glycosyltransferase family 2 protein [Microthrixaceae bacterium]MCB1011469.1 glycosyltransferase family 2 protein [Microthrixaceae bacterium]MCB9386588.1 glycosyltransferase family 2 protein [Microthrixaceae bacterium]MCO5320043.1 glycosyltransferase family 2 protein [Microthrixaceae bacterium]